MAKTIAEETREKFCFLKMQIKNGNENTIPYLSGSMNKRARMYKETKRYFDDARIDYELGAIDKEEYELEIKAVRLLERALANYKAY